jgi:hypothetical protein
MSEQQTAGAPRALRVLALVAVCAGVAALAAGAFIFSYAGLHTVALQAGVSSRLARGYPLILDVLLVVILAAVLALRGAGWPSKLLAWISLIALLAAAAGADALHAAHDRLPVRTAEITVAVLPWALVLIAFVLLLAMLRQARLRRSQAGQRAPQPKWQPPEPPPLPTQPLVPGFSPPAPPAAPGRGPADTLKLVVPRQITPPLAADASPGLPSPTAAAADVESAPPGDQARDGNPAPTADAVLDGEPAPAGDPAPAADAVLDGDPDLELAPDDPSSDEAALDPADGAVPYPSEPHDGAGVAAGRLRPAPTGADTTSDVTTSTTGDATDDSTTSTTDGSTAGAAAGDDDPADADMPVFHRMWSSPVPPGDGS